jgi:hypothetical protein
VKRRTVQIVSGLAILAAGVYLVCAPLVVAHALGRPHATSTQMINLRASWGGVVVGLGAFVAWLPAVRPWLRTVLGALMWAMAGVGAARLVGFAIDGHPDTRQWIWISAEVVIVAACAIVLARRRTP